MLPNTLDFLFEKINCCFFQYVQIQQIFWGQKVNLISAVSRQLSWAHFHSGNLKSGPKSCIKAFISGLKSADAWNRKSRIKPSNEIFVKDSWNFGGIWIHIPLRHWKNIAGTFWIFFRRSDFWFLPWQMVDPKRSNQHPDSKSVRLTGYICYHFSSGNTDPNSILKKIYKIQRFPKKNSSNRLRWKVSRRFSSRGSHFKLPPSIFFTLSSMTVPMVSKSSKENTWWDIWDGLRGDWDLFSWMEKDSPKASKYLPRSKLLHFKGVAIPFQKVDFNSIRPLGSE